MTTIAKAKRSDIYRLYAETLHIVETLGLEGKVDALSSILKIDPDGSVEPCQSLIVAEGAVYQSPVTFINCTPIYFGDEVINRKTKEVLKVSSATNGFIDLNLQDGRRINIKDVELAPQSQEPTKSVDSHRFQVLIISQNSEGIHSEQLPFTCGDKVIVAGQMEGVVTEIVIREDGQVGFGVSSDGEEGKPVPKLIYSAHNVKKVTP